MKPRIASLFAAGGLVLLGACAGMPDGPDNAGAIAARQAAMKAIGAASAPLRNPDDLDAATARATGRTIHENLEIFAANLPAGSGPEAGIPTRARSEIWTSSDAFNNALNLALTASDTLANTSGAPDDMRPQAQALMQACAGCHTAYRI